MQTPLELKDVGSRRWSQGDWAGACEAWSKALEAGGHEDLIVTLYSNRAAAYLKLNNAAKATDDAQACVAMYVVRLLLSYTEVGRTRARPIPLENW
mmetsp:Transcript_37354/g.83596  ORF Transcript_37354/g.83596 Transcript_37354/m.83596 type:complete len:96 (-) Transcript_37354:24-311(-)